MKRAENKLIFEQYQKVQETDERQIAIQALDRLAHFLDKENASYRKVTGSALPPPDPYALNISNNPLVQRYVSTRMHYYGGGANKEQAAWDWAKEAMSNPTPLD